MSAALVRYASVVLSVQTNSVSLHPARATAPCYVIHQGLFVHRAIVNGRDDPRATSVALMAILQRVLSQVTNGIK
jgi:hypothetical protein